MYLMFADEADAEQGRGPPTASNSPTVRNR
jgi:hypothetical protein